MIVSRTPLRIGLIGGGSDLPSFFRRAPQGGSVLGLTVDLYVYTSILALSPIAPERIRLTYRKTESVNDVMEIEHPVVRAVLEHRRIDRPVNIATMSDVPGGTGLGSSSSFTVGLLAALDAFEGSSRSQIQLAQDAILIERHVLGEAGGWQDQYQAAIGGFRRYDFLNEGVSVLPALDDEVTESLRGWMLLVAPWKSRASGDFQDDLVSRILVEDQGDRGVTRALEDMVSLSRQTYETLSRSPAASDVPFLIADVLRESWRLKMESGVKVEGCDGIVERAMEAGALAGKLCGAGGGGFVFILTEPGRKGAVVKALSDLVCIEVNPESAGVRVRNI